MYTLWELLLLQVSYKSQSVTITKSLLTQVNYYNTKTLVQIFFIFQILIKFPIKMHKFAPPPPKYLLSYKISKLWFFLHPQSHILHITCFDQHFSFFWCIPINFKCLMVLFMILGFVIWINSNQSYIWMIMTKFFI